MKYYAELNGSGIVKAILETTGTINQPSMIEIPSADVNVLGKRHISGTEFEAVVLPPTVPQSVTRFQALAALHLAGHLVGIEAYMAAESTAKLTKLAWQNALSFERQSPTVASLAGLLGLTDAQVDALFVAAKGITA